MATVILNNDAKVQVANGSNNMSLRNAMAITNIITAYPDKLPDDFKLVFHNDLRYMKRDKSFSENCYCGLVPFFNGKEHLEFAMLQWDLLIDDIATFDAKGEFVAFSTPNDELHTYARRTASADVTVENWMQGIAKNFTNVADYKKGLIVDTLIGSDMTLAELAKEIDNIINLDVVVWDMKD